MKTSDPIVAVQNQRSALVIDRLMADVWCVALHFFFVLPGWVGTDPPAPPQGSTELARSAALQSGTPEWPKSWGMVKREILEVHRAQ